MMGVVTQENKNHPVSKALIKKGWLQFEVYHSQIRSSANGWTIETGFVEDKAYKRINGKFLGMTMKDALYTIKHKDFPTNT